MSKKKWCGLLAILMAVSIVFTSGALRPVNVYAETIADLQEQSEEHQKKLEEINQQIEGGRGQQGRCAGAEKTCWISRRISSAARSPTPSSRSMRWRRSWRTTSRKKKLSTTCSAVRCEMRRSGVPPPSGR